MPNRHENLNSLFGDIANSIRTKTGNTGSIIADNFDTEINSIITDPSGSCTATNDTILAGYNAYAGGVLRTGTIPTKTSGDLSASGATVTVPSGYYASQATKSISTGAVSATAYSNGNVHFNVTSAGYVDGSKNTYKQYVTKAATSITPSTSAQTAIPANTLATGAITVAAVANATAGNIKKGVSIAGVAGSLEEGIDIRLLLGSPHLFFNRIMTDDGNNNYVIIPNNCHKVEVMVGGGGGSALIFRYGSIRMFYAGGGSGNIAHGVFNVNPGERYNLWVKDNEGSYIGDYYISNDYYAQHGSNGITTVFGENLLVATGGRAAYFDLATNTLHAGDGLAGGGIFTNNSYSLNRGDNTRTITLQAGNGTIGGGGGINLSYGEYYNNRNYKYILKAGNGGPFGGGGGISVSYTSAAGNNILQSIISVSTGRGGIYGGNGGYHRWNQTGAGTREVVQNSTRPSGYGTQALSSIGAPRSCVTVPLVAHTSYSAEIDTNGMGGCTLTQHTYSSIGGCGIGTPGKGAHGGGIGYPSEFGTTYSSEGAGGCILVDTAVINSYKHYGYGGNNTSGFATQGWGFVRFIYD